MKIKFKKVVPTAEMPFYAHTGDAGMDVKSVDRRIIPAGERRMVRTGLSAEIPMGYEIQVRPRSGLALNKGITVLNSPGTIDAGYRGEIGVILFNSSEVDVLIDKGDRIAQLVVAKVEYAEIDETEEVTETERGNGGFGSTGK